MLANSFASCLGTEKKNGNYLINTSVHNNGFLVELNVLFITKMTVIRCLIQRAFVFHIDVYI